MMWRQRGKGGRSGGGNENQQRWKREGEEMIMADWCLQDHGKSEGGNKSTKQPPAKKGLNVCCVFYGH